MQCDAGFALPRLLKWIGIAFTMLVLVLAVLLFWLLRTGSGAQFALARAIGSTDGRLAVGRSGGTLAGPLTLEDVRWVDAQTGVDARIARIRVDVAPLELFAGRVHVSNLDIADVRLALTSVPAAVEQPAGEFSLAAPVDVAVDRLALEGMTISRDGQSVFTVERLDLGGAWTRGGAVVKTLALRTADGQVDLHGTISSVPGYPGNGETTFRWKVGDTAYAGTLSARGDGRKAHLDLALTAPTRASLAADLTQSHDLPWTARLTVPGFDPTRVRKDTSLTALGLDLEGSGDRSHGVVTGTIDVNAHRVRLDPLRAALDGQLLKIEALSLSSPQTRGRLDASGELRLAANPPTAVLALDWQDVELPADLVGQRLATHGHIDAGGSADAYHAQGTLAVGPPGQLADIALDLNGTPQAITLDRLALKQAKGGLDAKGTITLQPAPGWKLTAQANHLDPGAFAADWPGALDFDLASDGTLTNRGPDATVKLERLGGTLRKRTIAGRADLRIRPGYVVDGNVDVSAGRSRIAVSGRGGDRTDATIKLTIASLDDWLPATQGHMDGEFRVQGSWPKLAVNGDAHARKFVHGDTRIDSIDLVARISDISSPQGSLSVTATRLGSGAIRFDTLSIEGTGDRGAHTLAVSANGSPLNLKLALSGNTDDHGRWSGRLTTLDLAVKDAPALALERPAQLAWDGETFTASEICLAGSGPRVCASGRGGADRELDARYRIEHLPLALIARLAAADTPFKVDGVIGGSGEIQRNAAGALSGAATLASEAGRIAYPDQPTRPLLTYSGLALDARLSPQSTHASVRAVLDQDGRIDGEITLGGEPGTAQSLSGKVDLVLNDLGFVELLTSEVTNTSGRVDATYTFAGTTAAPRLDGRLTLRDFATEVPAAGLKLHDGDVTLHATDADHFSLEGTLKSGAGALTLAGNGGVGATAPLKASIKGENFLAADIPAARVVITPDLTIERSADRITVGGSIGIPKANVDLARLPGGGVSKTSPDVVVTDAEQPEPGKPLPVVVAVTVRLGDEVKLAGFGLDGSISGQLRVDQQSGKLATGTGTLNVGGTYKAYGQDLAIESGRLLFTGSALDNPGLDIRAARKILGSSGGVLEDTIRAGLQVRGTALAPVLTVFSDPTMQQSEALSYLITGKPLSGLKSGEGDMLGSAAQALGSAGGDLLAKRIGARTGVDAGVADSTALGGAAFTVGKYLSPKLYLSYGVGLFTPGEVVTLRYLISKRFNFEAQNATTGNRAGVNYRLER